MSRMTRISRREFLYLSAGAATGLVLGGCVPVEKAPEIKTLPLHFQPGDVAFAPQAVALKKGWFKEAGFDKVELVKFTAGALAGEALLADQIFMWTPGNLPVISMRHSAVPVIVLGNVAKTWPETLVVRPESAIEEPADLVGKRVALLKASTAMAVLANICNHYGVDINKIEVVDLPPPEQLTAFANGEVDAMINFFRFNYQARDEHGGIFRVYKNTSYFVSDEGAHVEATHTRTPLVFTEEFVRKNPGTTRALVAAMVRAQEFLRDKANREEAIKLFAEASEVDIETAAVAWDDLDFNPAIDQGYIDDMQNYTDYLKEAGRIQPPILDPRDYLYTDVLKELKSQYVAVEGRWKP